MSHDAKHLNEKQRSSSSEERKDSVQEGESLAVLGYKEELTRNRSLWTLLFQSLAIAAIPYGEGSPLISAIYGGGQLSIFLGWIVILLLDECIALSLGEFASRYPTSGGPSYWSFRMCLWRLEYDLCDVRADDVFRAGSEGQSATCVYHRMDLAHWKLDHHTFR